MTKTVEETNKELVLEGFDTLSNKRDYKAWPLRSSFTATSVTKPNDPFFEERNDRRRPPPNYLLRGRRVESGRTHCKFDPP
jgi:hypothetical protein